MNKFINSSKFGDELLFINNLGAPRGAARGDGRRRAGLHAVPQLAARLAAQLAVPKLLMNSSSSQFFDELMNLFITN